MNECLPRVREGEGGGQATHTMDLETERLMENPRCGVKDLIGHGSYTRRKR